MKPRLPLLAAICVAPMRTMRWMLDHPARRGSFFVIVLAAISMILSDLDVRNVGHAAESLGVEKLLLVAVLVCVNVVILSIVGYFGFPAVALVAGRMLGGEGTYRTVRPAVVWSLAPFVWALLYRVPFLFFWPEAMGGDPVVKGGTADIVFKPIELSGGMILFGLLEIMTIVWYLVVGSRTLAEAQSISPWRGFANLLLAVVLPFVAIAVIAAAAFLAVNS